MARTSVTMHVAPNLVDECTAPGIVRVRFAFTASGTERAGGAYVNMTLTDAGKMADAVSAAQKIGKRFRTGEVTLVGILRPTR